MHTPLPYLNSEEPYLVSKKTAIFLIQLDSLDFRDQSTVIFATQKMPGLLHNQVYMGES